MKFWGSKERKKHTIKYKQAKYNAKEALKEQKNVLRDAKNIDKNTQTKILAEETKKAKQVNQLNRKPKGIKEVSNSSPNVLIDLQNVNKKYVSKALVFDALKDVNLTIKKGEFVVILGPSGSGKTTLLNVISGLDRATTGNVIVEGLNLSAFKDRELTSFRRAKVGFIFQSYNLLPSLNVFDNIEIGRALQNQNSKRQDIDGILKSIGMEQNKTKQIYELSGGQQQRVSIARALSKSPLILIGDEPTGAIDHKTAGQVLALFQKANRNQNTTVIIVTHNIEIASLADKVINVLDGRIQSIKINKNPVLAWEQ